MNNATFLFINFDIVRLKITKPLNTAFLSFSIQNDGNGNGQGMEL